MSSIADSHTAANNSTVPVTRIRPATGWHALNLREFWRYRELLVFMTWRDLIVRYKQTILGVLWAIINPILSVVVFYFVFNQLGKLESDGLPYPVFNLAGLIPWNLFAVGLGQASRSLIQNNHMLTKVYFPRMILPVSSVLAGLADMLIAFVILIVMMVYYRIVPSSNIWALPLFILMTLVATIGVAFWLSALNVLYRDVNYISPFLSQILLFLSPVVYSSGTIPPVLRMFYSLNPMSGVIDGFRWSILGIEQSAPGVCLLISCVSAVVILISGMFFFKRMERIFADMV